MDNRGKINYKSRSKQVKDYSGVRYGNITPTDIDGFLDFGNKIFAVLEYKHVNAPSLTYGQELALVRLVDTLAKTTPTIGIIATHETNDNEEIDCANAMVEKYRSSGKWINATDLTVKMLLDKFLKHNGYEIEESEPPVETKTSPIKTKEEYEQLKARVEALSKKIDDSSGWLSEEPAMRKMVNEQQRLAGQMLEYEIENDLLPI